MERRIKLVRLIYLVFFLLLFNFTPSAYSRIHLGRNFEFVSAPTLIYPTTDNISLIGKNYLEFKWERANLAKTDYFDFRLYKGYNTTQANLIFKQQFSAAVYPIRIPVSLFEDNQIYTWMLIEVFYDGRKSDPAYSSFKIIKIK